MYKRQQLHRAAGSAEQREAGAVRRASESGSADIHPLCLGRQFVFLLYADPDDGGLVFMYAGAAFRLDAEHLFFIGNAGDGMDRLVRRDDLRGDPASVSYTHLMLN